MKFGKKVLNNFWLKIISLIFAIITWFYVINLIDSAPGEKSISAKILPSYNKMLSKKAYVKAVFAGEAHPGYKLILKDVKVDPPYFIIAGPKFILKNVDKLETVPIDISAYRKTIIYDAQIAPIAQTIDTEKLLVKVIIPIKKIEPNSTTPKED